MAYVYDAVFLIIDEFHMTFLSKLCKWHNEMKYFKDMLVAYLSKLRWQ